MEFDIQVQFVYLEQLLALRASGSPELAVRAIGDLEAVLVSDVSFTPRLRLAARMLPADEVASWDSEWPASVRRIGAVASFTGVADCELDDLRKSIQDQGYSLTEDEYIRLAAECIGDDLQKFAGDFVLASDIALAGALHPHVVECTVAGMRAFKWDLGPGRVAEARAEFAGAAWPEFTDLPLGDTLAWLHSIPGFKEGVPVGALGRAVAALSHLLGHDEESVGADLMWAMIGLESLYTGGREGLSEQLRAKISALLGEPTAERSRFKSLYSYRSRFVHGGLDMPLSYTPFDGVDAFWESQGTTYKNEKTAIAILVSTLQRMAMDGRRELTFRWQLDEPETPAS